VSLEFKTRSSNILLGRTLAGKISLLRLMAGLDRPKLANEKPQSKTMPYDRIMKEMLNGKLPL